MAEKPRGKLEENSHTELFAATSISRERMHQLSGTRVRAVVPESDRVVVEIELGQLVHGSTTCLDPSRCEGHPETLLNDGLQSCFCFRESL